MNSLNFAIAASFTVLLGASAQALVSGPESSVVHGETVVAISHHNEFGSAKPMETQNSWQDSKIEVNRFFVGRGLGDVGGVGSEHVLGFSVAEEVSIEEQKGGVFFYKKDRSLSSQVSYSLKAGDGGPRVSNFRRSIGDIYQASFAGI